MNSHNPHVIPGQYNPQSQAKTEAGDYLSVMFEGYIDPTQVPMRPGDTQVPMQREQVPEVPPAITPTHPEVANEYQKAVEAQYRQQNEMRQHQERSPLPRSSPIVFEQSVESNRISTVVIPISIELTINLKINHV